MDQQMYPPAPPAPPAWNGKTNGLAIASLALGLIGCGLGVPSVVMGFFGLRQASRNGDRRGRVYAILGLVVGSLWLLAIMIAVVVAVVRSVAEGPDRDAGGAIRSERSISVAELRAGDCIKDLEKQSGRYVDVLPCAQPHSSEVIAVFALPDGPWPGVAKVQTAAEAGCDRQFTGYAGKKPGDDVLLYGVAPTELDWPDDREVICLAEKRDGSVSTGSLRR